MNINNQLKFLFDIGKEKPNSINNKNILCPFCHRECLTDILDENGPFILVKNKYPTLENTLQTVLIETNNCNDNMSTYDKEYMRKLIQFGVNHWLSLKETGEFKSVIFYKNHGPHSGGTINHSHMQIVGLKDIDYEEFLRDEFFEGITINKSKGCILNLSTKPRVGFTEFNIIIDTINDLPIMADNLQKIIHYILNNFYTKCDSFNLFFYEWRNHIVCKIIPRFVTSPLFIGFSISQISNHMDMIVRKVQQLYFNDNSTK